MLSLPDNVKSRVAQANRKCLSRQTREVHTHVQVCTPVNECSYVHLGSISPRVMCLSLHHSLHQDCAPPCGWQPVQAAHLAHSDGLRTVLVLCCFTLCCDKHGQRSSMETNSPDSLSRILGKSMMWSQGHISYLRRLPSCCPAGHCHSTFPW